MATVIDSLVVLLRLDPQGQFRKDQERVEEDQKKGKERALKNTSEIENGARKVGATIGNVRREVLGLLSVFTAGLGIKQFTESVVTSDAEVGRLSKQINVATDELSAWQGVLRRNGGASNEATQGLGTLTKAFQDIQLTGQSPLIPYLQNLRISLADLQDPSETLLKIADQFAKMPAPRAAALGAGFGFSPAMIATLSKGRAAVEKMLAEQRQLGVVNEDDAQKAQNLQNVLSGLGDASARIGRNILYALEPAIKTVTGWLQEAAKGAQKNGPVIEGALTGIAIALGVVAAETLAATWPFLALGAALAAIGSAIAFLIDDWRRWKEGGPSTFDWSAVEKGVTQVVAAFGELKGALGELGAAWGEFVAAVPPEFWDGLRRAVIALGVIITTVLKLAVEGLTTAVRVLADVLRGVAALLRGDFSEAWKQAGKVGSDVIDGWKAKIKTLRGGALDALAALVTPNKGKDAPAPAARPAVPASANAVERIKGYEGFRANAYWDRNAWRVGYGSDTLTDPKTGKVTRVTQNTKGVTKEQATADLNRRVSQEFAPRAKQQVGKAWDSLPQGTKDSLVSVAYNYGSLPKGVVAAAKTGDNAKIAEAVAALQTHNEGVNRERRLSEAQAIRSAGKVQIAAQSAQAGAAARPAANNDNRSTTVNVNGPINVVTQAKDAPGVARALGPALQQHAMVAQANTGLSG